MMKIQHVLLLLLLYIAAAAAAAASEDLYKLLGVARTATTKEIKSAYRKKALATHPDKNKDIPPEQAAEAFHKVVHAFEILTDERSRKNYDRTGRAEQQQQQSGGGGQQWGGFQRQNFRWSYGGQGYRQPLKDKFEVKEAMSRVMHIVSLEQLKNIMLDDDDRLERNLLMIFVTPGDVETNCDEELVFPYPFAGMSTQQIWWEDLLQTVKVRFHRKNDVTNFLGIPHGDDLRKSGSPIILFAKRGQKLEPENFVRLQTRSRTEFEAWVWTRIHVSVTFVNNHSHAVDMFWIHERNAKKTMTVQPGARMLHNTMLSHEWWARDSRVDSRPDSPRRSKISQDAILGIYKIVSDEDGQEILIESRACVDLSGHCQWWAQRHGECKKNEAFMAVECPRTCKFCTDDDDIPKDDESEEPSDEKDKPKSDEDAKSEL